MLPSQNVPLPVNPELHSHVVLLMQVAFELHISVQF